jgi:PAS domain S-box-containing protein
MRKHKEVVVPIDMQQRAESVLRHRLEKTDPVQFEEHEVRRQYHELQVSHIELEMQNSALVELQQARLEIEAGLKKYTDLFDYSPVGYITLDQNGALSEINLTSAHMLGVAREKLAGQLLGFFITEDYRGIFKNYLATVFATGKKESCEIELLRVDGSTVFVQIEAVACVSDKTCHAVLKDISQKKNAEAAVVKAHEQLESRVLDRTADLLFANHQLKLEIEERKRAEEALRQSREQLRQLTIHQESVKEGERKRIAREIHDDLGQNLLALRIDVSMLHARTALSHPSLHKRASSTLQVIDACMKSVRGIINNLRPSTLDIGLQAAIEWQVKEFERRFGIQCNLSFDTENFDFNLEENVATGLFRILQESLTNVSRHANASQVNIKLMREKNKLYMQVIDNGVGIRPGCRRKANSFGLIGIQERISQMNGDMTIKNVRQETGTILTIAIPL